MSDFEYEYEVLTSIDNDLAGYDYLARRDVRMVRFTGGPGNGRAVWLALRANGDFEVSDVFSAEASDEVSRYHRVQAYEAVRQGHAVTIEQAEQAVAEWNAAKAKAKASKSKAKVAA
jgi:hypothetical protein